MSLYLDSSEKERLKRDKAVICLRTDAVYVVEHLFKQTYSVKRIINSNAPIEECCMVFKL